MPQPKLAGVIQLAQLANSDQIYNILRPTKSGLGEDTSRVKSGHSAPRDRDSTTASTVFMPLDRLIALTGEHPAMKAGFGPGLN